MPEVFLTVYLNVFQLGALPDGGTLLVHGGGSGIGTAAIQLVKEAGGRVVVTAGPTREAIDPVRFISNHSSGQMGFEVARAAAEAGAEVILVSGPVGLETPAGVQRVDVVSAADMHAAVMQAAPGSDIFIGVAAVADYRPQAAARQKIHKTDPSTFPCLRNSLSLTLTSFNLVVSDGFLSRTLII